MITADREQILKWDIEQLWNACQILTEDEETSNKEIEMINEIKTGYEIKVPIYYFIQEWFDVYPNTKRAKILGYGKYPLDEFMQEIENRTKNMRMIILNNLEDSQATEGR